MYNNRKAFDVNNQFERITFIKEVIEYYFEKYKHIMVNPNISLYFEMASTDKTTAIIALHCESAILIKLGLIDGVTMYCLFGAGQNIDITDTDKVIEYIETNAAFIILHEMYHGTQNLYFHLMDNMNYVNTIEDSANYGAISILREEGYDEYIIEIIINTQYNRGFMHVEPFTSSYFDYYYNSLTANLGMMQYETRDALGYSLSYIDNITIANRINNNNISIPIKVNGIFLQPSKEFTDLLNLLLFSWTTQNNRNNFHIEVDYNNDDILILNIVGSIRYMGLVKDIDAAYGIANVYKDMEN